MEIQGKADPQRIQRRMAPAVIIQCLLVVRSIKIPPNEKASQLGSLLYDLLILIPNKSIDKFEAFIPQRICAVDMPMAIWNAVNTFL